METKGKGNLLEITIDGLKLIIITMQVISFNNGKNCKEDK